MGTRLDWPFSHTHSSPSRVYIVLVFCHVSEVANHVCVMKGELAGSWYTEVDPLSLFPMLLLSPLVSCTGSMWQCESTTWGNVRYCPEWLGILAVIILCEIH